eukprot:6281963-Amphidinium_carterae.1
MQTLSACTGAGQHGSASRVAMIQVAVVNLPSPAGGGNKDMERVRKKVSQRLELSECHIQPIGTGKSRDDQVPRLRSRRRRCALSASGTSSQARSTCVSVRNWIAGLRHL